MNRDSNINVAVIGGGLAGLSAAAELSEQGIHVCVFEAAPQLGGRARSVEWKGLTLDNGQHILLGAYQKTLTLMQKVGLNAQQLLLRQTLNLHLHQAIHLKAWGLLPAPLNLLMGLLSCKGLSVLERFRAVLFFQHLKKKNFKLKEDIPLYQLLIQFKQSKRLIESLWEPLCLAALNTPIESASAQIYLNILKDSFNQKKTDSDLLLPRMDLSQLLAQPIADYVRTMGGELLLGHQVHLIESTERHFIVNETQFSHVILATAAFSATKILDRSYPNVNLVDLNQLRYQPIFTVYLQYPATVKLPNIMIGFTNKISQWVFDRGQLNGQSGLLAVIISAEGKHQNMTQDALANKIIAELKCAFPHLPAPDWYKVIAEKRATFACTANLKRPHQKTSIANLYLAGDYTEGDYPATIEGAIRNGISAARFVMES
jgi:squalene-associated FAD-dependent desaturase